jgi:hypothetical protein
MRVGLTRGLLLGSFAAWSTFVPACFAQQPDKTVPDKAVKVVEITGLTGVKNKTGGKLAVEGANLQFTHGELKSEVAAASMDDVVTGEDSQRVIHGTLGSIGLMAAPYGSGRFLSLFRSKLDTLTVKYRDADGGLHGVIFMMPTGKAAEIKKELLAQGAHTTVADDAANAAAQSSAGKEQKQ